MGFIEVIADEIDKYIESCKEKEFVVFHKVNMTNGRWDKCLFTKKELLLFIKEHELANITVFRIKDEVKIEKIFRIDEEN